MRDQPIRRSLVSHEYSNERALKGLAREGRALDPIGGLVGRDQRARKKLGANLSKQMAQTDLNTCE